MQSQIKKGVETTGKLFIYDHYIWKECVPCPLEVVSGRMKALQYAFSYFLLVFL